MSRKNNLLVKNTNMSLHDRFTQIQKKVKSAEGEELLKKRRTFPFLMEPERRPEVASSLFMDTDYSPREFQRSPLLFPQRSKVGDRLYNSIVHDNLRPMERVNIPVHERLAFSRVPLVEERRKPRRIRDTRINLRGSISELVNNKFNQPLNKQKNKRRPLKKRDAFSRKSGKISKEDLDQQLDQFMSHTKQKRDEELHRVIENQM
ncbi:uncharacterized protein LOC126910402 [Daktulosphaira vitifoliae]|uniref:uncharacterized protein LOC126910402 n=1 Tax=Daktulosphaira vitifoliae TaxID=58002 RepID=UPI0021A9CB0F|nr:uncharacterized protein LOC126910402 [Daktulosphaira vitifoliae]